MTRFDIVGMDDERWNPADFPALPEENMPLLESSNDLFRSFFNIYRAIKKHFPARIREREDMNLTRRIVCFERTLDNRFYLSIFLCMESALYAGNTISSLVNNTESEFPARPGTIEIELCSFRQNNDLLDIVIFGVEKNPGFIWWNLDSLWK